jgi:hypothetical protein
MREEIMFYIIAILAAIFAMPAKADETLKLRQVQHTTWVQSQQVGDVSGHLVGAVRQAGIVLLPDDSKGTMLVIGTFDTILGSEGTASGYFIANFADGSELQTKYTGTIKYVGGPSGKLAQKGTFIVTGGKGRYAGAKGDGTFEGEQTQASTQPGEAIAVVDSVFNIKK